MNMLNIELICACTGKNKESYYTEAASEYAKRIGAYAKLRITETAETDAAILAAIPPHSYKIALCIEGKQLSSPELAEKLDRLATDGHSTVCFLIGGSDGFGRAVEDACDFRLSFSKMTFPHRLMRVILLEQIYRALNINGGGKYHK